MNSVDYLLYDAYSDHVTAPQSSSITIGYVRNSQHHLAADWNEKEYPMSYSSLDSKDNFRKTAWRSVQIRHDIIICEETASECLPYVYTAPKIVQISAFLNSRDWLLKCAGFESADFQMSPSDICVISISFLSIVNF
jgi:hypothetical protein